MSASDHLDPLVQLGIELWTEGGKLRFRAPKGVLTPDLRARLAEHKDELLAAVRERDSQHVKLLPLAHNQAGLWFIHQIAPESPAYNVAFTLRIRDDVDIPILQQSFQAILDRHQTLRSTFVMREGKPLQRVFGYQDVAFQQIEVPGLSDDDLSKQVFASYEQPFDLEYGPVMRVALFSRAADDHVLLLTVHHAVLDGWSMWIVLDELQTFYSAFKSGESASLSRPETDYSDYVRWQTELLAGPEGERLWTYWKDQLAGELPTLNLATDHPRPLQPTYQGESYSFMVDAELAQALRDLAKVEGTTLYTVLLAAFQTLLHRYTGEEDVIVGGPTFGRSQTEFSRIVGHFVNMVPLRANFADTPTFRSFLAHTRQTVLSALEHQDYPFQLMVERLNVKYDPSHSPVFQATFDVQRVQQSSELTDLIVSKNGAPVDFGGLRVEPYPMPQQEGQFDVGVQILETNDALPVSIKYRTDLFNVHTAERMAGHFETLLRGIIRQPDSRLADLPLLSDVERRRMLVDWNDTRRDYPLDTGVHRLIEAQVERTPDAVALMFEDEALTYANLNRRANRLAHYLRGQGVGTETLVGVFLERSLDMVVGVLGILKAGGAYVPLDPTTPRERLGYMIEDTDLPFILTQTNLMDLLPGHTARLIRLDTDQAAIATYAEDNPPNVVTGENLCYVIFTSGSTGRPKGVQVLHRGLTNVLLSAQEQPGIQPDDVILATTTLSFDIAGLELYLPLIVGGRVALVSREVAADGRALAAALDRYSVTFMFTTPTGWRLLIEAGWSGRPGLKMLGGGEPLPPDLAALLLELGGELWNPYGPTETTILSTVGPVTRDDAVISIGRPIANTRVYVLDNHLQPVPIGVPGTLYIGGVGVARGYIKRPDLTAERFIPDPFVVHSSARIYNTGDVARWLPNGQLECLGRTDHQVKVRGHRIELGEIEAALVEHPGVEKTVVMAREDTPGDKRLVAYCAPSRGVTLNTRELRDFLKTKLPAYMIPADFVIIDTFPMTTNGKIDRRALPVPEARRESAPAVAASHTPMEISLIEVWRDVLNTDQFGVFDNFFDLGGHSLQAMRVINRMTEKTGVKMEPGQLRFHTLSQLAALYTAMEAAAPPTGPTGEAKPQTLLAGLKRLVSKKQ